VRVNSSRWALSAVSQPGVAFFAPWRLSAKSNFPSRSHEPLAKLENGTENSKKAAKSTLKCPFFGALHRFQSVSSPFQASFASRSHNFHKNRLNPFNTLQPKIRFARTRPAQTYRRKGKFMSDQTTTIGCSEKLIIEGERLEDFHALVASLVAHYQPADPHEHSLVEDLAHSRWFLWRRQRASNSVEAFVSEIQPDPARWSFVELKRIAVADRYRASAERSFNRALKNVEAFFKERVKARRWEATYDLAVRRLELRKQKHTEKAALKAETFRSAKSAVSSPVAPTPQPVGTPQNPEKGDLAA
jgi:hypothetical protein